jgi:GNAT superfamily N-acetyltransferase
MTLLPDGYHIRVGTVDDLDIIVAQRRGMMAEAMGVPPARLDEMERAFRDWAPAAMAAGEWRQWFVECNGVVVAGAALHLSTCPPGATNLSGRQATLYNVYTDPAHRRRGLGRALVTAIVDWGQAEGLCGLLLHATQQGRPLYASLGFTPTSEMRLWLKDRPPLG